MSIYFVEANGLIKIGYSADVEKRVAAVLAPFGITGRLLGVMPGDSELEKFFHMKFAEHRSHGEWFRPCGGIDDVIAICAGGPPKKDKVRERTVLQTYEDKYAEDSADSLHAAREKVGGSADEFFGKVSEWCGIEARRLRKIYDGEVDSVTAAEYTLCRALGEEAGFKTSLVMDA